LRIVESAIGDHGTRAAMNTIRAVGKKTGCDFVCYRKFIPTLYRIATVMEGRIDEICGILCIYTMVALSEMTIGYRRISPRDYTNLAPLYYCFAQK
jgi:hypothetical protein